MRVVIVFSVSIALSRECRTDSLEGMLHHSGDAMSFVREKRGWGATEDKVLGW